MNLLWEVTVDFMMEGQGPLHKTGTNSGKSKWLPGKSCPREVSREIGLYGGAHPLRECLITQDTYRGQIFQTFHCLSGFGLQNPNKMRPRIAPWACLLKQWVWTCSGLTGVKSRLLWLKHKVWNIFPTHPTLYFSFQVGQTDDLNCFQSLVWHVDNGDGKQHSGQNKS